MTPIAARYTTAEMHPLRPKILHMYANRDPNTLWWRVIANNWPLKRVVRSWSARRARAAFQEALRLRGFQPDGRPLTVGENEGKSGIPTQRVGLKGTADIHINMRSIKEKDSAVQKEMLSLVDTLVRIAQKSPSLDKTSNVYQHQKGR
jgi:hypothetical protein